MLTLLVATCATFAATITVSNNFNSPAQYTDIQEAVDAAASGDTILIAGSPTTYI